MGVMAVTIVTFFLIEGRGARPVPPCPRCTFVDDFATVDSVESRELALEGGRRSDVFVEDTLNGANFD